MKKGGKIRKIEILCLAADVVVYLCRALQGEDVFLASLKGILNIW